MPTLTAPSTGPTLPAPSTDPILPAPRRRTVLVGLAALVLGTEAVLVAPHLSGAMAALAGAEAGWVGLAVLAVAASLTAFGMVRRRLLSAAGVRVGVASAVASILVSNAFHVTLPGGIAFSTAYSYRWMRDHGAGAPVAGWNLGVNGLLSAVTLAGLGLTASLASGGTGWARLVVEVGAVALLGGGARRFVRRPDRAVAVAERLLAWVNLVLRRPPGTGAQRPAKIVAQLRSVRPGSRDWAVATTFALLNWLFDVACLAACAHATGTPGLTPTVLLVAYVAGMAASSVSLLPGGVGVVDGALVLGLVAGGIPAAAALSAVVLYRLVSLVGVVTAGWAVHGTHQLRSRPSRARGVSWPTTPRPAPVLR